MIKKIITTCMGLLLGLALFGVGLIAIAILVTYPKLPSLDSLQHYKPKNAADDLFFRRPSHWRLRRTTAWIHPKSVTFPKFWKTPWLPPKTNASTITGAWTFWGVARAAIGNVMAGGVQSGASTITQQVAKNFYLSSERSFTRKFNEALLAYKIEQSLSKDKIFGSCTSTKSIWVNALMVCLRRPNLFQ